MRNIYYTEQRKYLLYWTKKIHLVGKKFARRSRQFFLQKEREFTSNDCFYFDSRNRTRTERHCVKDLRKFPRDARRVKFCLNTQWQNLRDSSTSTLTLEAAFERLVKTLLTFFSSLAVSVNLQSRAFSKWFKRFSACVSRRNSSFFHILRRLFLWPIVFFFFWKSSLAISKNTVRPTTSTL